MSGCSHDRVRLWAEQDGWVWTCLACRREGWIPGGWPDERPRRGAASLRGRVSRLDPRPVAGHASGPDRRTAAGALRGLSDPAVGAAGGVRS